MKYITLLLAIVFFCIGDLFAQDFDRQQYRQIEFSQGKLIGNLPYGRSFFIYGNNKLKNGAVADKVVISIYDSGLWRYRRKQKSAHISTEQKRVITSNTHNLVDSSEWNVAQAEDPNIFRVFINSNLQCRRLYLVKLSFYKNYEFVLTDAEKDELIENIVSEAVNYFGKNGEISSRIAPQIIREESEKYLLQKIGLSGNTFHEAGEKRSDLIPNVVVGQQVLDALNNTLRKIGVAQGFIEKTEEIIRDQVQPDLDEFDEGSVDFQEALEAKKEFLAQIAVRQKRIENLRAELTEKLQVIKNQLVKIGSSYIKIHSDPSLADLEDINIGTSFGAAAIGFDVTDSDNRQFNALSYTGLKFRFLPVDKGISDPYLDVPFINRMSFLLGVSFSNKLTYRGQDVKNVIGFFPILGLSYDANRYFSFDLGATFFKQDSANPLSSAENLRVGPIIGLTLDMDLLNRFKSTFTGEQYLVNPN